jgi:hypothetical protein
LAAKQVGFEADSIEPRFSLSPSFFLGVFAFILQTSSLATLGWHGGGSLLRWVLTTKQHSHETLTHVMDIFLLISVTIRMEDDFTLSGDSSAIALQKSLFPSRWHLLALRRTPTQRRLGV